MARTRRGWAWAPYASPHPLDPPLKYSSPCLVNLPQPHPWWLFPHKVKGYADDLIVIFTTPQNHQVVLHRLTIDNMRSAWLFSLTNIFQYRKVRDGFSFKLSEDHTDNIKSNTRSFHFINYPPGLFPNRDEYKIWIHRQYQVPSLHYKLAVDAVAKTTINKINTLATKYINYRWLGLTRSTSVAVHFQARCPPDIQVAF